MGRDYLVERHGEEEARRMRSSWGKKGGETGGNGLQKLTSKQKSEAGTAGGHARKKALINKYGEEKAKEMISDWGKQGMNKRWVDSLSTPKTKENE